MPGLPCKNPIVLPALHSRVIRTCRRSAVRVSSVSDRMASPFDLPPELEHVIDAPDAAIDELSPEHRRIVARVWSHRAESEMTAAVAFTELTRDLFASPADARVRFLAAQAVAEEIRHSEVCRRLASRYAGRDLPLPAPRAFAAGRFGDCPEPVNRTLRVVLLSSVNETIGSAMLSACLEAAEPASVREVLRFLLRDEINHARVGYAHLASPFVNDEHRNHVRAATPTLLSVARQAWYAPDAGLPDSVPPGHGCLSPEGLRDIVEDAIVNLVEPGLRAVV